MTCRDILKLKSDASDIYRQERESSGPAPDGKHPLHSQSNSQEVGEVVRLISALKSKTLKLNQFVAQTSFHFHYDPFVVCHSDVKNVSLLRAQT